MSSATLNNIPFPHTTTPPRQIIAVLAGLTAVQFRVKKKAAKRDPAIKAQLAEVSDPRRPHGLGLGGDFRCGPGV